MLEGIEKDRFAKLTTMEQRWLNNVKKAFYHSDVAMQSGQPQDNCLSELLKSIDTAKTLRHSLRGEDTWTRDNRKRFIEFLALEIPAARKNGSGMKLRHARTGKEIELSLGEVIYDVRCMIHENENLNAAEDVDYHIQLDWSVRNPPFIATACDGFAVVNGFFIWNRLREVMAKFITGLDTMIGLAKGATSFAISIQPAMGSIGKPVRSNPRTKKAESGEGGGIAGESPILSKF